MLLEVLRLSLLLFSNLFLQHRINKIVNLLNKLYSVIDFFVDLVYEVVEFVVDQLEIHGVLAAVGDG